MIFRTTWPKISENFIEALWDFLIVLFFSDTTKHEKRSMLISKNSMLLFTVVSQTGKNRGRVSTKERRQQKSFPTEDE